MASDRQVVESFHLHFVRLLCAGPDKDHFAVKGGCNIRFFFESVRYSEDIDLDVTDRVPLHVLKEKVSRILEAPALSLPLRSRGIKVSNFTAPKQTETTQRWKVSLSAAGHSLPLPTKIEFSRRGTNEEPRLDAIAPVVAAEHQLVQFVAPHYPLDAALRQKVGALVGRNIVQARDVFDLGVLVARAGGRVDALRPVRSLIPAAVERVMAVSHADFKSQVASYLQPEHLAAHDSPEAWEALRLQVMDYLERARAPGRRHER